MGEVQALLKVWRSRCGDQDVANQGVAPAQAPQADEMRPLNDHEPGSVNRKV